MAHLVFIFRQGVHQGLVHSVLDLVPCPKNPGHNRATDGRLAGSGHVLHFVVKVELVLCKLLGLNLHRSRMTAPRLKIPTAAWKCREEGGRYPRHDKDGNDGTPRQRWHGK